MPKRSWTDKELIVAVATSFSVRSAIKALGLVPAGGNYSQVQRRIKELGVDTTHFTGMGWNVGIRKRKIVEPAPLNSLLATGTAVQSYKLKHRLFAVGLKKSACELCGWSQISEDGRIPVELDHINGIHTDNRLENLRILCPNCHSLQATHRGMNKKVRLRKLS